VASQSRKHRGYRSQKVLANYLAENGFPFAESTGAGRSGTDITGTIGIDWEVKASTGKSTLSVRSIQIRTSLVQPTSTRISLYALPVGFKVTRSKLFRQEKE